MAEVLATYVLDTDDIPVLEIGVQNENAATAVVFDYTAWANNYGDGDIGLILLRKGDEDSYPATLVTSRGDNEEYLATWNISAIDTAIRGRGQAQLSYFADTQVKKTVIFRFIVKKSIGTTDPFDYEPIVILDDEFITIENRLGLPHPTEPPLVSAILDSEFDSIEGRLEV